MSLRFTPAWSLLFVTCMAKSVTAADGYDLPPIEYSTAPAENVVADLEARLASGKARLSYSERFGFLKSLLEALDIPASSQVLVFSQTSLQRSRISPETPRAIYFNDEVYVGFCQGGEVLEISVADTRLGTAFYTLAQQPTDSPRFTRETDRCLQCHQSSRTEGVPGHLVRSMFVEKSGQPIFSGGSYQVDYRTPFEHRWGGWYVTGHHGDQKHLGNLIIEGREAPAVVDNAAGHNLEQLPDLVEAGEYLSPHSDIVALMVLEHQTLVHNLITKANFTARQALAADREMRQILGTPEGPLLESTTRRIRNAASDLVNAILFKDETTLTAPVRGTSNFAADFASRGPRDSTGRSLREFDLNTRMFRYPCSDLVRSRAFGGLPPEMRDAVWARLREVLVDGIDAERWPHLTSENRAAIVEILSSTDPDIERRLRRDAK
jgi:hypothetical protein